MLLPRLLAQRLPSPSTARRLVLITGARQTGKTTLAKAAYSGLRYLSLDELEVRLQLREIPTRAWAATVGPAILDEAQKEPSLFEKVKFAFDDQALPFSVLLGSSQILMIRRIRESLAGRILLYELYPFMLKELIATESVLTPPLFDRLLNADGRADDIFGDEPPILLGEAAHWMETRYLHMLTWGGMPPLLDLPDAERRDWLHSYTNTYVERDLSDLARLDDVEPFRRFTRLAAHRSGQLLSYAELARDAGISPGTARNYLNYLSLSYQVFTLTPYFRSSTKSLVKAPKLYWLDVGLWRQQTGFWGDVTGPLLETFVVGEAWKWLKTTGQTAELGFYRTHGGLEVDLMIATPNGLWGIEIKTARRLGHSEISSLRRLAGQFGAEWRGGLVAYQGNLLERLDQNLWAIPVARLFG
jgi:hypothetical protein